MHFRRLRVYIRNMTNVKRGDCESKTLKIVMTKSDHLIRTRKWKNHILLGGKGGEKGEKLLLLYYNV